MAIPFIAENCFLSKSYPLFEKIKITPGKIKNTDPIIKYKRTPNSENAIFLELGVLYYRDFRFPRSDTICRVLSELFKIFFVK